MQVGAQVFDAMGNHALLQRPMHAVHVRRRFSDQERRAYMNACILAARQGRVLVGAFVSEYEQQVRTVTLRGGTRGGPIDHRPADRLLQTFWRAL